MNRMEKDEQIAAKEIDIADYDYPLPDERIARYPVSPRDTSKLLYYNRGAIATHIFSEMPQLLDGNELLVYNNTKVIQARMFFEKATGAVIEIFCLEPHNPADYALIFQTTTECTWQCMVGNARRWKTGALEKTLEIDGSLITLRATKADVEQTDADGRMSQYVRFEWNDSSVMFSQILEHFGNLPIPPYLCRETEEADKTTYQTIYSKYDGSVAAPTAGLHFTRNVLDEIERRGVVEDEVTLHVGAGTFHPVKTETIGGHAMHRETIEVQRTTIEHLMEKQGSIVAVGTTSVRTLESLYFLGVHILDNPDSPKLQVEQWEPYNRDYSTIPATEALQAILGYLDRNRLKSIHAATRIIIVPGYTFRIVGKLITNFHQPRSTLLLLVSAFVGIDACKHIYSYALANNYRFLSYGDSSLLVPGVGE